MPPKKKISVSELKVHALQIIETVKHSKQEVEIYKRGVLVAKISPASLPAEQIWLGSKAGTVKIKGKPSSIIGPLDEKWEALDDEDPA